MDKKYEINKIALYILFIIILTAADQITKKAATAYLFESDPYVIITDVLELNYTENRGAAFGMLKGMRYVFLLVTPLVILVLFISLINLPGQKKYFPMKLCFIGIISGAAGNFIDRLSAGYVVDFIYFKLIDFPVFNVADIYVTCSAIGLILLLIFYYDDKDWDAAFSWFSRLIRRN